MRRLLSLPSIGLGLLAVAMMAAMVWLGLWQFGVYDSHQRADAQRVLADPPVPLDTLLGPDQAFPASGVGRPVVVTGHWLTDQQVFVTAMPNTNGRVAVVTPLVTSTGSAVLVVRGSAATLAAAQAAPAPTSTTVRLTGVLEPSTSGSGPPNRDRVMPGLSVPSLVNAIRPDLYSGYVVGRSESTTARAWSGSLAEVAAPLPSASHTAGLLNLLYACQWWSFAAFTAWMWWRVSGDLTHRVDTDEDAEPVLDPTGDGPANPAADPASDPASDPVSGR